MVERLAMWHLGLLVGLTAPLVMATAQQDAPPRRLDYARAVHQSTMVYIPYQGLGKRGPVYFSEYQEEVSKTSQAGDLRRLFVNLTPKAFKDGSYQAFVNQYGIVDDKVLSTPAESACHPTQEIQDLLYGMPDEYRPSILGGNWPYLCTLSVWFLPDDETKVRSTIAASRGISLQASIPLCAADSPQVDSPAIVQQLIAQGVLRSVSGSEVTGNLWDVLYASVALARDDPRLFGTSDPREGWSAWMAEFKLDTSTKTATLKGYPVQYPVYVCRAEPLVLSN